MGFRYKAEGVEAEFEPASRHRVLRNLLGIHSVSGIHEAESTALLTAQELLVARFSADHRFSADDIREIHRLWLGKIYHWAGEYRNANVSKGEFRFAAAREIPRLMGDFERKELADHTPCVRRDTSQIARSLAVVHAELVIIHPFRDGNGRCARLLAVLMALQAGLPPLDFGALKGKGRQKYFAAVQAGFGSEYGPMPAIFEKTIGRTLRRQRKGGRA